MSKLVKSLMLMCIMISVAFGSTPKVGERAPEFSLPASDGRTVSSKEFSGKKLVLVFYRGYW